MIAEHRTNSHNNGNLQSLPMERLDDHILSIAISTEDSHHFGAELIEALAATVQIISLDESIRAVILQGGSNYFSAGGSSTALTELDQQRNILFRAIEIPQLLLDIPVPTIAAMQGHAIGGGFMLGMWSDIQILAEESRYGMNAVNLGVPPVMGATEILPDIIGTSLTQQLLYTGRLVKGRILKNSECGLAHNIVPKKDVHNRAVSIAEDIAEAPRDVLVLAKKQLLIRRRALLDRILSSEMAMLRTLFAGQTIQNRIMEQYPQAINA